MVMDDKLTSASAIQYCLRLLHPLTNEREDAKVNATDQPGPDLLT